VDAIAESNVESEIACQADDLYSGDRWGCESVVGALATGPAGCSGFGGCDDTDLIANLDLRQPPHREVRHALTQAAGSSPSRNPLDLRPEWQGQRLPSPAGSGPSASWCAESSSAPGTAAAAALASLGAPCRVVVVSATRTLSLLPRFLLSHHGL